jgi:hypothetical protein
MELNGNKGIISSATASCLFVQQSVKQHISRFRLIVMKMYLKIKYCEVIKESNLQI